MLTARPCGLDLRNLHPVIRDSGTRGPSPNNGLSVSEHGGRLSVRRLGELNVHPEGGALGRLPGLLSQGWACPLLQGLPWGRGQNSCNARKGRGLQGGGSLFPGRPWGLLVRGALVLGPPLRLNWRVREEREGRLGGRGGAGASSWEEGGRGRKDPGGGCQGSLISQGPLASPPCVCSQSGAPTGAASPGSRNAGSQALAERCWVGVGEPLRATCCQVGGHVGAHEPCGCKQGGSCFLGQGLKPEAGGAPSPSRSLAAKTRGCLGRQRSRSRGRAEKSGSCGGRSRGLQH